MSRPELTKAFVCLHFVLLLSVDLIGQENIFPYRQIEHFTTKHGLSNNKVLCFLQDKQGFMWFLAADGLNRYDGYSFKSYRYSPDHPDYILPGWFTGMAQDSSGIFWISDNSNGIYSFDPAYEKFIHYKYEPGNKNSLSNDQAQGIVTGKKNKIWIPTTNGLNELNTVTGKFKCYYHKEGDSTTISNNFLTSACSDEEGYLWITTASPGVDYFNPETGKVIRHYNYGSSSLISEDVSAGTYQINRGHNGNILIPGDNGITIYNTRTRTTRHYSYPGKINPAILLNAYLNILEDSGNNLWIPTGDNGLDYYNYGSGVNYHLNQIKQLAQSLGVIGCLFEDNNHKIWIGTDHGIFTMATHPKKFNVYDHDDDDKNSIRSNFVFSFYRDSRNVLYVGTKGVDIANDNFTKFSPLPLIETGKPNKRTSSVWQICEDDKNVMWFATINGLVSYNPDTKKSRWYVYNPRDPTAVSAQSVTGVIQDKKGRYWCATFGGGLNSFDPVTGKFRAFKKHAGENSISTNSVGNLFMDSDGKIFMMSRGGGLIIFNPDTEKF